MSFKFLLLCIVENLSLIHISLIFDPKEQDTHAGGSGCGCSASVLCGYFLPKVQTGEIKEMIFAATGALMSPTASQQGESIPSISHLVHISHSI